MGNCQAIDAAALVIQHPDGRLQRLYWQVRAGDVMRANPGHYVSLIIPLPHPEEKKTACFTRVKLLRPHDTLALGHAYRLITSQEVMKVLRANKYKKMKQQQRLELAAQTEKPEMEKSNPGTKHERIGQKTSAYKRAVRSKSWSPSLESITEAGS